MYYQSLTMGSCSCGTGSLEQRSNAGASLDHCREGEARPHGEVLDLSLNSEVPGVTTGPAGVIKYPT